MTFPAALLLLSLITCGNAGEEKQQQPISDEKPVTIRSQDGLERAYFASGCFWCVEGIYENLIGVEETITGYSGGHTENPTYKSVLTGKTGHAEAFEVIYDPQVIDFATLVDVYFGSQDPTQKNGQGPDIGPQYRSILFYQNEEQKLIIEYKIKQLEKELGIEVAAEVKPFKKFWKAEEYHQDFEQKNPQNPYIRNVSHPRNQKFRTRFPHLIKEDPQ